MQIADNVVVAKVALAAFDMSPLVDVEKSGQASCICIAAEVGDPRVS